MLERLVGAGREPRGLGDHPGLERQQVAEDARQRDDHVDPRAAEFGERDQLGARQPAIAVEPRPRADQRQRLRDLHAFGSSDCRCPTAPSPASRGRRRSAVWRAISSSAWRAPSAIAKAPGMRNGSKPWMLRPVGSTFGLRSTSPPGAGATKPRVERVDQRVEFAIVPVGSSVGAGRRSSARAGLVGHRLAEDVEAVRDQLALEFVEARGRASRCRRASRSSASA